MTVYYKGRPYEKLYDSQVKIEGNWYDCVIYKCLYPNPDGEIWVRLKYDFELKFKEPDSI